jgi:predicted ribosomally synthesized peptide with nif11-like leader
MSKKAVEGFLARVDDSAELRDTVRKALEGKDEQAPTMVELGSKEGFEFTTEEYTAVIDTISRYRDRELSEEELEVVSGGSRPVDPPGPAMRIQFKNFRLNQGVFS